MSTSCPDISVLLPVYNAERFLLEAVESILTQNFENFELLAIDDGSIDGSLNILSRCIDPRLRIIVNDVNSGITSTLNRGLSLARGKYVARIDADDRAYPTRFERQIEYLKNNPNVAVVGTWANVIDDYGNVFSKLEPPASNEEIRRNLVVRNSLIHPSVLMRRDAVRIVGGYRQDGRSQDYDLWLRLAERFEIANIPEYLLDYRIHLGQVSTKRIAEGYRARLKVKKAAYERAPKTWGKDILPKRRRAWKMLTAAPGTLGDEFLDWSYTYRLAGKVDISRTLAFRSLLVSPFSRRAHSCVWKACIGKERLRILSWYVSRLRMALSSKR